MLIKAIESDHCNRGRTINGSSDRLMRDCTINAHYILNAVRGVCDSLDRLISSSRYIMFTDQ